MLDDVLKQAAQVVRGGGIVAFPTETFYGLAVDPTQQASLSRLLTLKQRDADKGIPVIAADFEDVARYFHVPEALIEPLRAIWPAPLSVALKPRSIVSPDLSGQYESVAVRVSDNQLARGLARLSGGIITATSANLSGDPPSVRTAGFLTQLAGSLDYVLDAGETPGGLPSTIVALEDGGIRIHRRGEFDATVLSVMCKMPCLP
jgi:L-threonylcarbamoyladenylate synthase